MSTRLQPDAYLPYWETASSEEIGILIRVDPNDQKQFINSLYIARDTFGGYEDLIVMQPMPEGTIYIAHKSVELD